MGGPRPRAGLEATFDSIVADLKQYGVRGMHWGIRRKSSSGGSSSGASRFPAPQGLSDSQLQSYVNRLNLEKQYSRLVAEQPTPSKSRASSFVKSVLGDVGKRQLTRLAGAAADLAVEAALGKSSSAQAKGLGKELARVRTKKK